MSKLLKISSTSTEYINVRATYMLNGVVSDPSGTPVRMAFVAPDVTPTDLDWRTANWEATPNRYNILCLVGPNGQLSLLPGFYNVWIKLINSPEDIVKRAGSLLVE